MSTILTYLACRLMSYIFNGMLVQVNPIALGKVSVTTTSHPDSVSFEIETEKSLVPRLERKLENLQVFFLEIENFTQVLKCPECYAVDFICNSLIALLIAAIVMCILQLNRFNVCIVTACIYQNESICDMIPC